MSFWHVILACLFSVHCAAPQSAAARRRNPRLSRSRHGRVTVAVCDRISAACHGLSRSCHGRSLRLDQRGLSRSCHGRSLRLDRVTVASRCHGPVTVAACDWIAQPVTVASRSQAATAHQALWIAGAMDPVKQSAWCASAKKTRSQSATGFSVTGSNATVDEGLSRFK